MLAADRSGAWIVGLDDRGRSVLTLVPPGGGRRRYFLGGPSFLGDGPLAVAAGLHAVWVLDRGRRGDRLLRLDLATGRLRVEHRFPLSSGVDTLTVGFRDLWLVGSSTATLYRVDPHSGKVAHVDLGRTAGRPVAMAGAVWVIVSNHKVPTVLVDPRTLRVKQTYNDGSIGPLDTVGADSAGAFRSVWTYDVGHGEVQRWYPPDLGRVIQVTHAPHYDGNCMTSMAAGGGAVWVTLARSEGNGCNLF
ncbi:MAG: hypothetical protein ACJ75L_10145 [Gaiellaceae bacterium]